MGIWVKSQKGKLLGEYTRFFYSYTEDSNFNIVGTNGTISDVLGCYDLEKVEGVMKMIQEHASYYLSMLNSRTLHYDDAIFEMPQDSEV